MLYSAFVVDVDNTIVGCVAQLVEQLTLNQWVWGSNPHAPTNFPSSFFNLGDFFVSGGSHPKGFALAPKAFFPEGH